jgi:MFS family permease
MNAPFYVYISRWFDRRRGSALALISSGSYVAGAVWPPVFERAVTYGGWRQTMLFSAAFGLGFAGIIPAYVLAIRELFPAPEAYWRIPTLLLCSGSGMALGGWLAGVLYDHFGTYAPAFAAGVAANAINLAIVGMLVLRQRSRSVWLA